MDSFFRVAGFILFLGLLLVVNSYLVYGAYNLFLSRSRPSIIAPFQIIREMKTEQEDDKLGDKLAMLLQARFARIRQQLNASAESLDAPQPTVVTGLRPQVVSNIRQVSLPGEVFKPLEVSLTVGGVEVGGVLSRLHSWLVNDRVMQVSAFYGAKKTIVAGELGRDTGDSFWVESQPSHDEIVADAAYAIAQLQAAKNVPELGALALQDFRQLLESLDRVAVLNRQVSIGQQPRDEFAQLLPTLERLREKVPRWAPVLRLTAQVAANAKQSEKAIAYYKALLEQGVAAHERQALEKRISELTSELVAAAPADPKGVSTGSPRVALSKSTEQILKLLNVPETDASASVRIAVVGGVPPEWMLQADSRIEVLGAAAVSPHVDSHMEEYAGSIAQVIRFVAPRSTLVFHRSVGSLHSVSQLIPFLQEFLAAKVQVMVIPYGPFEPAAAFEAAFRQVADENVVIVIPIGNMDGGEEDYPFRNRPILDRVMLAAATDLSGEKAAFSLGDKKCYWAPGSNLLVETKPGHATAFSGTGFSAALATGVVARFRGARMDLKVPQVLEALRETSTPAIKDGPALLNLEKALSLSPSPQ